MLKIDGDDVRVTGLILSGTSESSDSNAPDSRGIHARSHLHKRVIIDHNEIRRWTTQAVDVWGDTDLPAECMDYQNPKNSGILPNVRIARNYIHHNRKYEAGYGVEAHYGGFPLIEGNTFNENRHAIMADGKACSKYYAWYNLVYPDAPCQHWFLTCVHYTQDFDAHGTGDNGFGGQAGQYFDIGWNTFFGINRENFDLRGEPTVAVEYHHNISLRSLGAAVACTDCGGGIDKLLVYDNNQFYGPISPDRPFISPFDPLGKGDFDGDGLEDRFMATGAAWYYSLGGQTEWRFINAQPEKISYMLFGDFDADGRTDASTLRESAWFVSWGAASKWEKILEATEPISSRRFLDTSYNGVNGESNGTFRRPYTSFAEAVRETPAGGTLWLLRTQTIPTVGVYGKQITVRAAPGVVATLGS